MRLRTHRDNWSPLTSLERAGVRLDRERYQDVAINLDDPEVVAELIEASARKSIEVDESAREQLEAHGLTVTAAGAVVELETIEPRDLAEGEQLEEGELPAGAGERIPAPARDLDDDQADDAPTPATSSRRVRRGRGGRG